MKAGLKVGGRKPHIHTQTSQPQQMTEFWKKGIHPLQSYVRVKCDCPGIMLSKHRLGLPVHTSLKCHAIQRDFPLGNNKKKKARFYLEWHFWLASGYATLTQHSGFIRYFPVTSKVHSASWWHLPCHSKLTLTHFLYPPLYCIQVFVRLSNTWYLWSMVRHGKDMPGPLKEDAWNPKRSRKDPRKKMLPPAVP